MHDLRQLSSAIYNSAEEAKLLVHRKEYWPARTKIDSVIALQSMLKIRTDVLDFSGNPNAKRMVKKFSVFRKVDKVVRSFRSFSEKNRVTINLSGSSYRMLTGQDAFEIIPYLLIDNAIKYSPSPGEVDIAIWNSVGRTHIAFRSTGPVVESDEREKIFSEGYRSRNALASGVYGSGVGLFLARCLVDQFKGTLNFDMGSERYLIEDLFYCDICFEVAVPTVD